MFFITKLFLIYNSLFLYQTIIFSERQFQENNTNHMNRNGSFSSFSLHLLPLSLSIPKFSHTFSPFLAVATKLNSLRRRLLPRQYHLPYPTTTLLHHIAAKLLRHWPSSLRLPNQVSRTFHKHNRFFLLPLLLLNHPITFLPFW